jgi:aryl-alcohol dehydrogenase-like predicted oxidoreductase
MDRAGLERSGPPEIAARIALGTAQLARPYGISNALGAPSDDEAAALLKAARHAAVRVVDTAPAYGSERLLGQHFNQPDVRVVTKTPPFDDARLGAGAAGEVRTSLLASLERLQRDSVHGVLLHHARDLLKPGGERLSAALHSVRDEGLTSRIGVSVYSPAELEEVLQVLEPDLVQLPLNVLDQRFLKNGMIDDLLASGVEVHARSAFLQGLLLMHPSELPPFTERCGGHLRSVMAALGPDPSTRAHSCLDFALSTGVHVVVVGVARAAQLQELLLPRRPAIPHRDDAWMSIDDEGVLDPSRWPPAAVLAQVTP